MQNFEWDERDYAGLRDMLESARRHEKEIAERSATSAIGEVSVDLTSRLESAIAERDIGEFLDEVADMIPALYHSEMPLETLIGSLARSNDAMFAAFEADFGDDPHRLMGAARAYAKLRGAMAVRIGEAYSFLRTQAVEEENRKVIRELSTPVIQVWEGVLVMPLVGIVDTTRANQMMEQLLSRIGELSTRVVILDVTGVPTVDTEVANHFLRATRAARLLGATSIVVGISPKVAQALVRLNVDLGRLETYTDLRSGLQRAIELLGQRVVTQEAQA